MQELLEEERGGIEPYGGKEETIYGGSKRRKRGKRNSRKNSRRRSKNYMKKMYRGGESDVPTQEQNSSQEQNITSDLPLSQDQLEEQGGGRRRRKGKMQKGKTRKGKVSKWITHVKNFSRANKMDFRDALKDPKCKASYHKMK
jgi:hypothetical protein